MWNQDWRVVLFSMGVAAVSTLLILPFGVVVSWLLARRNWWGKSIVETFITLPLVMPPVATGLVLLKLLGRRGAFGSFFYNFWNVDIVFTWKAIVIAMAVMSFPLLVRSARSAFEEVNPRLEQVARTLGARPLRVFFRITLPLAKRGIIGGILLAFARALGEFGATILVAGFIPGKTATIAVSIYHYIQLGDDLRAYQLVAISTLVAFIAVFLSEYFLKRTRKKTA